jgi:hypothetical protein
MLFIRLLIFHIHIYIHIHLYVPYIYIISHMIYSMLYIPIYCHCCLVISPDRRRHFGLPSRRPVSVADAAGAADLGAALSAGGEDEAQFSRHFGMMFGKIPREHPWGKLWNHLWKFLGWFSRHLTSLCFFFSYSGICLGYFRGNRWEASWKLGKTDQISPDIWGDCWWPIDMWDLGFHHTYSIHMYPRVKEHRCGKSSFSIGNTSINGPFSTSMLVYPRVPRVITYNSGHPAVVTGCFSSLLAWVYRTHHVNKCIIHGSQNFRSCLDVQYIVVSKPWFLIFNIYVYIYTRSV